VVCSVRYTGRSARVRATLRRGTRVLARATSHGGGQRQRVTLHTSQRLTPGKYTLTLIRPQRNNQTTTTTIS
jgi:hypothetical protein